MNRTNEARNIPTLRNLLASLLVSVSFTALPTLAQTMTYSLADDFSFADNPHEQHLVLPDGRLCQYSSCFSSADFDQPGCEYVVGLRFPHSSQDVERGRGLLGNREELYRQRAVLGQKWNALGAGRSAVPPQRRRLPFAIGRWLDGPQPHVN